MITEDRMMHMLTVARKCYALAKERNRDEDYCRHAFIVGLLHDIGYEFSEDDHEKVGAEMTLGFSIRDSYVIMNHGKYTKEVLMADNDLWQILNIADMTTTPDGDECSVSERLFGIMKRYGKDSREYRNAENICKKIKIKRDGEEISLIDLKNDWLCGGDGTAWHRHIRWSIEAYEKGKQAAIQKIGTWQTEKEPETGQHIICRFENVNGNVFVEDKYYNEHDCQNMTGWIPFPEK